MQNVKAVKVKLSRRWKRDSTSSTFVVFTYDNFSYDENGQVISWNHWRNFTPFSIKLKLFKFHKIRHLTFFEIGPIWISFKQTLFNPFPKFQSS